MGAVEPDRYTQARREMVREQIAARGVHDKRLLAVMESVPREHFVPLELHDQAFTDQALSIEAGQTISQPYMVAAMTEKLDVRPYHRVLEIGTGSGYQTMILAELASWVYTIERLAELGAQAKARLESLNVTRVSFRVSDGSLGWPEEAPFDRIMVTAAAPAVPPALLSQLRAGGRMVIPVGDRRHQTLMLVERWAEGTHETAGCGCRFVPLLGENGWPEADTIEAPNS